MARRHDYIPTDVQAGDSADDWLSQNDPLLQESSSLEARELVSEDLAGTSIAAQLEHRILSMPTGVQQAFKNMAEGTASISGAVSVEQFYNVAGVHPRGIASRIKNIESSPVTITDISGNTKVVTAASYTEQDRIIAEGMFSAEGLDKYLSRGVGGAQEGNVYATESSVFGGLREREYRGELMDAYATMRAIAPMLIHSKVPRGTLAYETRLVKSEEGLINYAMESVGGIGGNRHNMPNPNDIHFRGRRDTIGRGTGSQGTPFTQLEYDIAISPGGSLYGLPEDETYRFIPSGHKSYGFEKEEYNEIKGHYLEAAKVIRASTLTNSDEVYGNKERSSGYQQSREDWDARSNLMNEASEQDMDMYQPDDLGITMGLGSVSDSKDYEYTRVDPDTGRLTSITASGQFGTLQGSSKGGMHGERGLSEQDIYIENLGAAPEVYADTDQGRHLESMVGRPKQGSRAWLAERAEVDFTASTIGILGTTSGIDKLSVNLRLKEANKLSVNKSGSKLTMGYNYLGQYVKDVNFIGNTYSKEGNEFESDVKDFFMARHGDKLGLTFEEASFERGTGRLSNFGVTPDGRMFDKEGKSAGLAEFKLLRDTTIDDAYDKYYDQIQLQMAVTGETQAHLYALDQHTDKGYYYNIKADPERQEFLISSAEKAKELSGEMSMEGTKAMMSTIKARQSMKAAAPSRAGEEARLSVLKEEGAEIMKAFEADDTGPKEESRLLKAASENARATAIAKAAVNKRVDGDIETLQSLGEFGPAEPVVQRSARQAVNKERFSKDVEIEKYQTYTADEVMDEAGKENDVMDRANKKLAKSADGASKKLKAFTTSLSKAGKILGNISSRFTGEDAIDEERLAAETGQSSAELLGQREILEQAGMSTRQINSTVRGAASFVSTLNNARTGADKYTSMKLAFAESGLGDLDFNLAELRGLDNRGVSAKALSLSEGKSSEQVRIIMEQFGVMAMTTAASSGKLTGEQLSNATSAATDKEGAFAQAGGVASVEAAARRQNIQTQSRGRISGQVGAAGDIIARNASVEGLIGASWQGLANLTENMYDWGAELLDGDSIVATDIVPPSTIEGLPSSANVNKTEVNNLEVNVSIKKDEVEVEATKNGKDMGSVNTYSDGE